MFNIGTYFKIPYLLSCPSCQSQKTHLKHSSKSLDYVYHNLIEIRKCDLCQLTFSHTSNAITQAPKKDVEKEKYQKGAYNRQESQIHKLLKRFVFYLESEKLVYFKSKLQNKSLLEIGCGKGNLLLLAHSRRAKTTGIDINLRVSEEVEKERNIELIETDANALAKERRKFNFIVLWHVLEHIPEVSTFFKALHQICLKETEVLIAVPNIKSWQYALTGKYWYHLDPNRHLYHFNVETLSSLLVKSNFEIQNISYNSFYQNFMGDFISLSNLIFKIKNLPFNFVRSRSTLIREFGSIRVYTQFLLFVIYSSIAILPISVLTLLSQMFKRSGTIVLRVRSI